MKLLRSFAVRVVTVLAIAAVIAACDAGTPSGLGPQPGGGGGGTGSIKLVGFVNDLGIGGPLSFNEFNGGAQLEEVWIIAHDPNGTLQQGLQANPQTAGFAAFDPGTQTPAAAQPNTVLAFFRGDSVIIVVEPVPTTAVDYFVDDGSGNTGTLQAKFPVSNTGDLFSTSPPDQSTGAGTTPALVWDDLGVGAASYLVYVFGTPAFFPGHLPFTGDVPVIVETSATQYTVGSGTGAITVFADGTLPSPNAGASDTWGWLVIGLDQDGWGFEIGDIFFEFNTQ